MITDGNCLMQTDLLSYPKSRDAMASKKIGDNFQVFLEHAHPALLTT